MPAKPKPPVKLPAAKIGRVKCRDLIDWSGTLLVQRNPLLGDDYLYCAVLPCRTRQEAREIVRLHNKPRHPLHPSCFRMVQSRHKAGESIAELAFDYSTTMQQNKRALHLIP